LVSITLWLPFDDPPTDRDAGGAFRVGANFQLGPLFMRRFFASNGADANLAEAAGATVLGL
jgi:hypothetical protein